MVFASMMNFQVDSRCFADFARFENVQVVVNADTDENGWQYAFVLILAGWKYVVYWVGAGTQGDTKGLWLFYRTKIGPAQCGWIIMIYNQEIKLGIRSKKQYHEMRSSCFKRSWEKFEKMWKDPQKEHYQTFIWCWSSWSTIVCHLS